MDFAYLADVTNNFMNYCARRTNMETQIIFHITEAENSIFLVRGIYRVIHKSLRDFRPLRYSSRDGHAEGEHVNRGRRDTPSFCPASAIPGSRDLLTSEGS